MAERLDYGFRCEGRFAAAREEVGRQRAAAEAAAAVAAVPSTTAPPKKLRAKKQAAQAAIEARAEREFQARYDDHQNAMFVSTTARRALTARHRTCTRALAASSFRRGWLRGRLAYRGWLLRR
jgi:hypothetical protein